MQARHMILPLNRPQYVTVPEALISALAWRLFSVELDEDPKRPLALLYQSSEKPSTTLEKRSTRPEGDALQEFGELLTGQGLVTTASHIVLGQAVAGSVTGIRAEKSGSQPASPLSPGLALMQNMRGLQGTKNPPDLGEIIESLFAMGDDSADDLNGSRPSAASLWLGAAERRLLNDPLTRAIDESIELAVYGTRRKRVADPGARRAADWRGKFPGTPYEWFRNTWVTLTRDDWVDALPARVWVDWATTVLRLGLGLGYLWEAAWYDTLARQVLEPTVDSWEELVAAVPEPLPWKSSRAGTTVRDIAPTIMWRLHRGDELRGFFAEWLTENGAGDDDLAATLRSMNGDDDLRRKIAEALGSRRQSGANVWEAVKYALKTRDASGPFADYYGVLKAKGRYLLVDPGTEWTAVVASLSCPGPEQSCNVGTVLRNLDNLGMRPELGDLVELLERAGMARGSADADHAVLVQSAF